MFRVSLFFTTMFLSFIYQNEMEYNPGICFTFLTLFLVSMHIGECFVTQFLDLVSGDIEGGNFTYFSLQHPGLLSLELLSHYGDCDLYVSQFTSKPTFELGSYCSESSSCGLDKIIIPKSFKRPLAIGIYGHPSYEASAYTLNIYQIIDTSDADNESDELYLTTKYGDFEVYKEENSSHDQSFFSYIIYFLSSIWNMFLNFWRHLNCIGNDYLSNEPFIFLDLIMSLFGV